MHRSRLGVVLIDQPQEAFDAGLRFWSTAFGREPEQQRPDSPYRWFGELAPGLVVGMQRLDQGAPRVHLDIHTDDVEAEVRRLEAAGATRVAQLGDWWQVRDPAGMVFCVCPADPADLADATVCE